MSIESAVLELIAQEAKLPVSSVSPDSRIKDLDLDSLSIVHVVLSIEDKFDVRVPDEEVGEIKTVQDVIDLCNRLLC